VAAHDAGGTGSTQLRPIRRRGDRYRPIDAHPDARSLDAHRRAGTGRARASLASTARAQSPAAVPPARPAVQLQRRAERPVISLDATYPWPRPSMAVDELAERY
jgi:hypothetical protein